MESPFDGCFLVKACLFSDRFFNDFSQFLGMERDCDLTGFGWVYVMPVGAFLTFEYPSVRKYFFLHFFRSFGHILLPSKRIIKYIIIIYAYCVNAYITKTY